MNSMVKSPEKSRKQADMISVNEKKSYIVFTCLGAGYHEKIIHIAIKDIHVYRRKPDYEKE